VVFRFSGAALLFIVGVYLGSFFASDLWISVSKMLVRSGAQSDRPGLGPKKPLDAWGNLTGKIHAPPFLDATQPTSNTKASYLIGGSVDSVPSVRAAREAYAASRKTAVANGSASYDGPGYLLYGSFASGDYTNRKIQLIEALAMAAMSGRKLLLPWMCDREPVTYLYDSGAFAEDVGVVEDTAGWQNGDDLRQWGVKLSHICGTEAVQLVLPHGFAARSEQAAIKGGSWRGVSWRVVKVRLSRRKIKAETMEVRRHPCFVHESMKVYADVVWCW
jgi:hypothetical protein